jgi:ppGpp synthetase/RelA/SpoT-type nucleotidyltranferase
MAANLTPEVHKAQIEQYTAVRPCYVTYAAALRSVLREACRASLPEAMVTARAKTVASFAEKVARKYEKYQDPVNQFTDLCGARVVVHTLDQVSAVCQYVRSAFDVVESEDKTQSLGTEKFGYRDMHFVVRLKKGYPYGVPTHGLERIGDRKAELQVRTWLQHAWADTFHNRLYKTELTFPADLNRRGNLLAAVMEEGDLGFGRLAGELDNMLTNYSAHASPADVEKEIEIYRLLIGNAPDRTDPAPALKLASLIAPRGDWQEIVERLTPYEDLPGALGQAVRSDLGHALCRLHRGSPQSPEYRRGQELLWRTVDECIAADPTSPPDLCTARSVVAGKAADRASVPDLRQVRSRCARSLARLGWSYEPLEADAYLCRDCCAWAVAVEPENPYYLAEMLGMELKHDRAVGVTRSVRPAIVAALRACEGHEATRTELPAAYFTAGRLRLLLGEPYEALHGYARGMRYCLAGEGCARCETAETEIAWLHRVNAGERLPEEYQWAKDTLQMGLAVHCGTPPKAPAGHAPPALRPPVLVVVGGAMSLQPGQHVEARALLEDALRGFHGTVISGGTTVGVPGCVGAIAADLGAARGLELRAYLPETTPDDGPPDTRYDTLRRVGGAEFSPHQVLVAWHDVLSAGVSPQDVTIIGFGGGRIAAFEYRLGLALGASVGVVVGSGGAAGDLLKDPLWRDLPNLLPLPADRDVLRAFALPDGFPFDAGVRDTMAQEFHRRYREGNVGKIKPDNLKPWERLPATYQTANQEQAVYTVRILEAAGFGVQNAGDPVDAEKLEPFGCFTADEIERMAQLEHGRWVVERLRDGWRWGPRDDANKLHNCLVGWEDPTLTDGPDGVKRYDREAVCAYPDILATAGLAIFRPKATGAAVSGEQPDALA